MRARLERDEERRPARTVTRRRQRRDLGVRRASPRVPALADDLAVAHEHRADQWMRRLDRPAPPLRELERPLQAHASAWTQSTIRARQVLAAEDRRPGDEQRRPRIAQRADVLRPDPAVDLYVYRPRQQRAQLRDALDRLGDERLPRVARMDAHAEGDVDRRLACRVRRLVHVRLRIERHPDLQSVLPRQGDDIRQVRTRLEVDGDAVGAGLGELRDMPLRPLDHQVDIEYAALAVDERRDPLEHDRADRHRRDEVTVADVEVEDAALGAQQHLDLLAEPREVGRVERRLDLDRADPVVPAHPADDRSRAMKNPEVWSRCGSVSRNSGRAACANCGHSSPSGSGSRPLSSTTASFSSALIVQTE